MSNKYFDMKQAETVTEISAEGPIKTSLFFQINFSPRSFSIYCRYRLKSSTFFISSYRSQLQVCLWMILFTMYIFRGVEQLTNLRLTTENKRIKIQEKNLHIIEIIITCEQHITIQTYK